MLSFQIYIYIWSSLIVSRRAIRDTSIYFAGSFLSFQNGGLQELEENCDLSDCDIDLDVIFDSELESEEESSSGDESSPKVDGGEITVCFLYRPNSILGYLNFKSCFG